MPTPTRRRSSRLPLVIAAVALALLAAWWFTGRDGETAGAYRTAPVERGDVRVVISATGTLRATTTVDVGSQVSGQVLEVLVDFNDAVSRGQLACLRDELSDAGYRRMKRTEVVAYVAENPANVDADIAVLEAGGARMMSTLMLAGVEQERTGVPVDQNEILAQASEEETAAFMQMMTGAEQSKLRRLMGIGNAFDAARSAEENETAGESAGADLATRVIMKAMSNCDVPYKVLFE